MESEVQEVLDILFLGKLFPKDIESDIKSKMKSGMQDAANALQWNIIDGLDANGCGTIKILDWLPVNSYPKGYTDKYIHEYVFQHTEKYKSDDKVVGRTNITVLKQFLDYSPIKKEVTKWVKTNSHKKKVIILYTASVVFLRIAKYIKKHYGMVQICCVIADLPDYSSARALRGIQKIYNDYQALRCKKLYKYVDKFVLLTEQMAQKLEIQSPYIVMEGIAQNDDVEVSEALAEKYKNEKYILYTGTLNYEFGIETLLKAFSLLQNKDVKLMICGFGAAEKAIKDLHDDRIVFLGRIDRSQVLPLQRNAMVLVNPRQNNQEFTKYSFPSKTMEYLAAGVPVVAYKLEGIPDEYDDYIHYVPDNKPETLAAVLNDMCCLSEEERQHIGERAKKFVLEEKNKIKQTKRILDFIIQ